MSKLIAKMFENIHYMIVRHLIRKRIGKIGILARISFKARAFADYYYNREFYSNLKERLSEEKS